jgi:hypothetical protein
MPHRFAIVFLCLAVLMLGPASTAQADTATQLPFTHGGWLAVDPAGGHVFVSGGSGTSSIVVLNYSGAIVKTITGEGGASQMALNPATHTLYVALRDATAISEINTQTLTETTRFSTAPYPSPTSLVIAGGKLWFSCFQNDGEGCSNSIVSANLDGSGMAASISGWFFATVLAAGGSNNHLLAVGDSYQEPATVAVYDVSGGTPTQISKVFGPNDSAQVRDMTFDPSGANLLLATGAPYYVQSLSTSTLLSTAQYPTGAYPVSAAVTANGKFVAGGKDTNAGPDTFVYPVGDTTPVRTFQAGDDSLSGVAHGLAFSPDASRLFALALDSATGHLAFHVLLGPTIHPASTTTSLGRSARSVRYGRSAKLTTHVGGTGTGKVDLYVVGVGGAKTLVATSTLRSGTATFTVKPRQTTTYAAELEEGTTYASSSSNDTSIGVTPILSVATSPGGHLRVRGRRVSRTRLTARVRPARPNEPLAFFVQRRSGRHWRTVATNEFPIESSGRVHAFFFTTKTGQCRVRVAYGGDTTFAGGKSAWKQFRAR